MFWKDMLRFGNLYLLCWWNFMSLHIKFKHSPLQKNCQSISSQKLSSDPKATFFRGLLLSSSQKKRAKTKLCGLEFCALGCKVDLQRSLLRRNWKVLLSRRIEVMLERSVFSRCAFDPKTETRRLNKPWSKYRKRQMTTTLGGGFDNTFVIYWKKRKW